MIGTIAYSSHSGGAAIHGAKASGDMHMQKLLFSALLAFGVGLSATGTSSAAISAGVHNTAASNVPPRVKLAAKGCREECDKDHNNCRQYCR